MGCVVRQHALYWCCDVKICGKYARRVIGCVGAKDWKVAAKQFDMIVFRCPHDLSPDKTPAFGEISQLHMCCVAFISRSDYLMLEAVGVVLKVDC